MALQFLNSEIKSACRNAGMCEIGKIGKFFKKDQLNLSNNESRETMQLHESGLNVLRGYRFTLMSLNSELNLQIDACSRVLQRRNLLEFMDTSSKEGLIGQTIITRYGNYRTYKIEEILYNETPLTKFYNSKENKEITYRDYFLACYGLKIYNTRQPLIRVLSRVKKEIHNNKMVETPEYINLIPELVSLTGMTDDQRADFQTMKSLAPFTKLSPDERMSDCNFAAKLLNSKN